EGQRRQNRILDPTEGRKRMEALGRGLASCLPNSKRPANRATATSRKTAKAQGIANRLLEIGVSGLLDLIESVEPETDAQVVEKLTNNNRRREDVLGRRDRLNRWLAMSTQSAPSASNTPVPAPDEPAPATLVAAPNADEAEAAERERAER